MPCNTTTALGLSILLSVTGCSGHELPPLPPSSLRITAAVQHDENHDGSSFVRPSRTRQPIPSPFRRRSASERPGSACAYVSRMAMQFASTLMRSTYSGCRATSALLRGSASNGPSVSRTGRFRWAEGKTRAKVTRLILLLAPTNSKFVTWMGPELACPVEQSAESRSRTGFRSMFRAADGRRRQPTSAPPRTG
jgi:hypothetical protein